MWLPQSWDRRCRGQLSRGFAQQCLVGSAFRQCTACSWAVVQQYRQGGWPFILQALQVRLLSCSVSCIARSLGDVAALPRVLQEGSTRSTKDAVLMSHRPSCGRPRKCRCLLVQLACPMTARHLISLMCLEEM